MTCSQMSLSARVLVQPHGADPRVLTHIPPPIDTTADNNTNDKLTGGDQAQDEEKTTATV